MAPGLLGPGLADQLLEALGVDEYVRPVPEQVAADRGLEHVALAERAPSPVHHHIEVGRGVGRKLISPERLDQCIPGDHAPALGGEDPDQLAHSPSAELRSIDHPPAVAHGEPAEQVDLHADIVPGSAIRSLRHRYRVPGRVSVVRTSTQ